jgi:hypothetical protein
LKQAKACGKNQNIPNILKKEVELQISSIYW